MVQFIGYRLNGPNIFRLAESIRGKNCTQFLVALDIVVEEFEERPDGFRIEIIPPPPDNPLGETVNLIFIIWTSSKTEPIPLDGSRRLRACKKRRAI